MKFTRALLLAALLVATLSTAAEAASFKMLFWYPGEAGSSEEGQPVIDAFLEYLSGKTSPDRISGRYENTVEGGVAYIGKQKPALGVLSYAAWAQNRGKFPGARVVLSTLPLPGGKARERYELVAAGGKMPAGARIFSSEPLSASFVRSELFEALPAGAKIESTGQMLFKLKEITEGKVVAAAILTPTESASLSRMKSGWAAKIGRVSLSKEVPSARVVQFDQAADAAKIIQALLASGSDPAAKEILAEMRLAGFSK